MITAVDTNVLIDVFGADPQFGQPSAAALRACVAVGRLIACEAVYAEAAAVFQTPGAAQDAMEQLGVCFSPLDMETARAAGACWRQYRLQGGRRGRFASDFLIGAHAQRHADRLLTRDRGFYRTYFAGLRIVDPSAAG